MKLILAITSTLYLASALPSRIPNEQLQTALKDCEYPAELNNGEDVKTFAQCFYGSSDLDDQVNAKVAPYKKLAKRLTQVYNNNQHNKAQMKKRMKDVMIKNAELFGMDKKQAAAKWNSSEPEIMAMVHAMNVKSMQEYLNADIDSVVDEIEQEVSDYLEPIIEENQDWYNIGKDLWAAFGNTETGKKVQEQIDGAEEILSENGKKSIKEVGKEVFDYVEAYVEAYDVEGKAAEIEAETKAALA